MKPPREPFAFIDRLKEDRTQIRELVALVVALSFAVNLLSSVLFDMWGSLGGLIFGSLLILTCTLYVVISRSKGHTYHSTMSAAFVTIRTKNKPIDTPGYEFGHEFYRTAQAVFDENPALEKQWQASKIPNKRLVQEIAEYVFLHKLSLHLSAYFNKPGFKEGRVREVGRSDVPHVLLSNRVLELISRDFRDRPGFDEPPESKDERETIIATFAGDRTYYRFLLNLPRESSITREADGALVIDSTAIRLRISTSFQGFCTVLPAGYSRYVLKKGATESTDYHVEFNLCAEVKNPLFSRQGTWLYYGWVESFISELKGTFDHEYFFEAINWEASEMLLRAISRPERRAAQYRTTLRKGNVHNIRIIAIRKDSGESNSSHPDDTPESV